MSTGEKSVIVAGIDDSDHSLYALNWTLDNLILQSPSKSAFKLVIVYAKASPVATISLAGPAAAEVLPYVESDIKKVTGRVLDKATDFCTAKSVTDVTFEAVEGDAGNVLCEAVERHQATMLVVGCHGYGAIKRAVLGSVSDYCVHHARCTVMIVKKPNDKN